MSKFGPGSDPAKVMRLMDAHGFPPERPVFFDKRDDVFPPGFAPDLSRLSGKRRAS